MVDMRDMDDVPIYKDERFVVYKVNDHVYDIYDRKRGMKDWSAKWAGAVYAHTGFVNYIRLKFVREDSGFFVYQNGETLRIYDKKLDGTRDSAYAAWCANVWTHSFNVWDDERKTWQDVELPEGTAQAETIEATLNMLRLGVYKRNSD